MPRDPSGNGAGRRAELGSARPGPDRSSWPGPPSAAGLWPSGLGAAGQRAPPLSLGVPGATRAPGRGAGQGPRHPRRCDRLGSVRPRRCALLCGGRRPGTRTAAVAAPACFAGAPNARARAGRSAPTTGPGRRQRVL